MICSNKIFCPELSPLIEVPIFGDRRCIVYGDLGGLGVQLSGIRSGKCILGGALQPWAWGIKRSGIGCSLHLGGPVKTLAGV